MGYLTTSYILEGVRSHSWIQFARAMFHISMYFPSLHQEQVIPYRSAPMNFGTLNVPVAEVATTVLIDLNLVLATREYYMYYYNSTIL